MCRSTTAKRNWHLYMVIAYNIKVLRILGSGASTHKVRTHAVCICVRIGRLLEGTAIPQISLYVILP